MISSCVLAAHWLVVIGLSIRVIRRRPPVGVSLAWLVVIATTPFVGAFLYLLFGEKRLGRGRMARISQHMETVIPWQTALRSHSGAQAEPIVSPCAEPMCQLAEHALGFPPLGANQFEILEHFQTVFDCLIADIDSAQSSCHLCFYIWHEGGRMEDLVAALVRAAERGVRCLALADGFGSKAFLRSESARRLRNAGVRLVAALPTGLWRTLFIRRDLRNHRKIVVIDGLVAYTGSQNLVDPRFFKQDSGVGEWVDAVTRITGPIVVTLDVVFALDWAVETGEACDLPALESQATPHGVGAVAQIVPSGPDLRPEAIHQLLLTSIYAARESLCMTTPYFVPDEAMLTALLSAALRGVAVTLVVPARNDSVLVRYASVAHFDELMSAGVRIELFEGGLLHTKSLTIDDSICVFGSVNLDMRSLWLNFEISLFIFDETFTANLRALQKRYIEDSSRLELSEWRQRPTWRRFAEDTCRLTSPLL